MKNFKNTIGASIEDEKENPGKGSVRYLLGRWGGYMRLLQPLPPLHADAYVKTRFLRPFKVSLNS